MAGAGVDKGARAVVDLAFGSDAGKLNLGSVLQKAKETHATLCKLEAQLHADAPRLVATATSSSGRTHATRWSHALDLFLLLHHQYGGLRAAFRETLQFWSVYPRQVDAALAMKLQGEAGCDAFSVKLSERESFAEEEIARAVCCAIRMYVSR